MNATLLLAIATLALVVGPFLERVARRLPGLAALIDGATVGGIVVISIFHLLPDASVHLGWWALFWLAAGLLIPTVAERLMVGTYRGWKVAIAVAVLVLFLIHEILESAALVSKANDERLGLATLLVVVGHRLPAGVLLWGQTRKSFGVFGSAVALGLVVAAIWFIPPLIPVELEFAGLLSALLAGGLLHLVLQHRPVFESPDLSRAAQNAWSAVGLLVAVALLVPFLGPHPELEHAGAAHHHPALDLGERLLALTLEVSFPLLLGVLGAAAIEAYLPGSAARWLKTGSRLRQAMTGVAIGAPMPVCSCGVLPIYRSLIHKGVPPTAALSFLIAASRDRRRLDPALLAAARGHDHPGAPGRGAGGRPGDRLGGRKPAVGRGASPRPGRGARRAPGRPPRGLARLPPRPVRDLGAPLALDPGRPGGHGAGRALDLDRVVAARSRPGRRSRSSRWPGCRPTSAPRRPRPSPPCCSPRALPRAP